MRGEFLRGRWIPLAIAAITLIVYAPALRNGFVDFDDRMNFLDNPHFRGLGWKQLRWMLTTFLMGHWIPLTWMTLGLDYSVWGMNPFGYHLTNVLLHAATFSRASSFCSQSSRTSRHARRAERGADDGWLDPWGATRWRLPPSPL